MPLKAVFWRVDIFCVWCYNLVTDPDSERTRRSAMKIQAVVTMGTPERLVNALNRMETAERIGAMVLWPYLHVDLETMGPAEAYLQECDFMRPRRNDARGCEVRMSGVSNNGRRSGADFDNAREALERIYKEIIEQNLRKGARIQLYVVIMIDMPYTDSQGNRTTLVEGKAIWVDGAAE